MTERLTVAQIVKAYPIGRTLAYRLIHEDWAAFTAWVGRKPLVDRDALERWLDAGGTRPREAVSEHASTSRKRASDRQRGNGRAALDELLSAEPRPRLRELAARQARKRGSRSG